MEKFFNKIEKTESCWNFTGTLRHGYGAFTINKKLVVAHRFSWELHFGKIPEGLFVCHKCDNKKCVNPDHLFLGTQKDNMQDCLKKGRFKIPIKPKTLFKNGHYPSNSKITLEKAIEIKNNIINRGSKKLIDIAKEFNVPYQFIRDISCNRILTKR